MKFIFVGLSIAFYLTTTYALQAPTAAQKQTAGTGAVNLTAKSANVSESGTPVRINILRWSSDASRDSLVAAMNPAAPAPAAGERGTDGSPGRGARGARGGAAQADDAAGAAAADDAAAQAGRGARGGRGGGRGGRGDAAPSAPPNPIASLTAAIGKETTIGYIWTNEVVGYSIKYAYRAPLPAGGERIILATDRRLGGSTPAWKLTVTATPTDYEFTVIEIRLDAKGLGEGKTSLNTKVIVDNDAKTVALDNYAATPAMLQSVKR